MMMTMMIMTKQAMRSLIVISIDDNDRDTNDKVEDENNVGDSNAIFRGPSLGGCIIRGGRTKVGFS